MAVNQSTTSDTTSVFRSIRLETAVAIGLMVLAAVRVLVSFDNQPFWNLASADNILDRVRFGHVATGVCDALFVLLLLGVLIGRMIRRQRVHGLIITAWATGTAVALYHGWDNADDFRFGSVWIGALAAGATAMHLADHRPLRRLLIASCAALILPLGLNAIHQVTLQHQADIEYYRQYKSEILTENGWTPGSAEQRKYETRLYQNEATGAFALANVFGSVALALTFLAGGVAVAAWRGKTTKSVAQSLTALALLGAIAVGLSVSKGVMAAGGVTLIGLGGAGWLSRRRRSGWVWITAALLIVTAGLAAAPARFALLGVPTSAKGERSLLFRYMYWDGAARMLIHNDPILGVGPGQFQRQFQQYKECYTVDGAPVGKAVCPEDVIDPHNVFVAYLATLGVAGLAWAAILIAWLVRAARRTADAFSIEPSDPPVAPPVSQGLWLVPGAIGAGWYAVVLLKSMPMLTVPTSAILAASVALFVLIAGKLMHSTLDERWMTLGALGAATALLLHNQIEMAMTNVMAAPLLMVILGTAAGGGGERSKPAPRIVNGGSVLIGSVVLVLMGLGVLGQVGQNLFFDSARAQRNDPLMLAKNIAILRGSDDYDSRLKALAYATEWQLMIDGKHFDSDGIDNLMKALAIDLEQYNDPRLWRLQATLHARPGWKGRDPQLAIHALKRLLRCARYDINQYLFAGDTAWAIGERGLARKWYERALRLEQMHYLDPNSKMRREDRRRAERRLKADG